VNESLCPARYYRGFGRGRGRGLNLGSCFLPRVDDASRKGRGRQFLYASESCVPNGTILHTINEHFRFGVYSAEPCGAATWVRRSRTTTHPVESESTDFGMGAFTP
jgi:hypothetical protein